MGNKAEFGVPRENWGLPPSVCRWGWERRVRSEAGQRVNREKARICRAVPGLFCAGAGREREEEGARLGPWSRAGTPGHRCQHRGTSLAAPGVT